MDNVPVGADGHKDGAMAKAWMEAASQNGMPTAFLISASGKIAWIGHPLSLDGPLKGLATGTWDVAAARSQYLKEQAQKRAANQVQAELATAQRSGDPHQVLAALDRAIAGDPALETTLGPQKHAVLAQQIKDPFTAQSYGTHLVNQVLRNNAPALNQFAWQIVDLRATKPDAAAASLALTAARRADELAQGKDAGTVDTLARAYFVAGMPAKAVETEKRAIGLARSGQGVSGADLA